ncbi:hypothetical protein GCM10009850_102800 [Nonomuraea monospora]|uniref:Uncharacterized protein n=1 Tax=Nonomuraea monospora TaxID=568818 RepID=A0ABN3CZV6_9ACTN
MDVVRAVGQQVFARPANIGTVFRWGGSGERQVTKEITYTNAGDSPVTLDLTVDGDTLRTSAQRVEVAAKGTASVTVTIDGTGKQPGDHAGTITARSGDLVVRTVTTAYVEPESHDVKVSALGMDGRSVSAVGEFYNAKGESHRMILSGVPDTYRLPAGEWSLYVDIFEGMRVTTTHLPMNVGEQGMEIVLDTRQAKPIRFTLDQPTAVISGWTEMWVINGSWHLGWVGGRPDPSAVYFVLASEQPGLRYVTRMHFHDEDGSVARYDLVDERHGGIPADPTYSARVKDLDKVTTTFRGGGTAAKGTYFVATAIEGVSDGFLTPTNDVPLPGKLAEYRTRGRQ